VLYVTRLELQNIRRFSSLIIDFNEPGCCALIVGDNGDGKSTVLRSLAMGLCDQSSAAALFRELSGEFVRRDSYKEESFVQVDLARPGGWRYRIRTDFIALDAFERIQQTYFRARGGGEFSMIEQDAFPWSEIFVSGYGPGIRTFGNADYTYYLAVDAVYSLFRYDAALQSPELVIRRLVDQAGRRSVKKGKLTLKRLREALARVLGLKNADAIQMDRRGITMTGDWGREELAALGDGYRATTTWTLDLMSWWLLRDKEPAHEFDAADLGGIVIIDELEQHLHPRWQRTILPDLRDLFPNIQFIVATHSPLIASSCEDVTVHRLQKGEHTEHAPFGWRAEDVYDMMGVPTSRPDAFTQQLARLRELDDKRLRKCLSSKDRAELRRIEAELHSLPGADPILVTIRLQNLATQLKRSAASTK
jgi:predicted ATPase